MTQLSLTNAQRWPTSPSLQCYMCINMVNGQIVLNEMDNAKSIFTIWHSMNQVVKV